MEDPQDVVGVGYPGPIEGLDPAGTLESLADLVNPIAAAGELPWLAGELAKIASGRSSIRFNDRDPRFADVTWRENPFFHRLGQSYRLYEEWMDRMVDAADGPWQRQARARYLASILTAAVSPTNFFWTNPLALKRAFETGGRSVQIGRASCRERV